MLKSYTYHLYPTPEQRTLIEKHFGCTRYVYNWAIEQQRRAREAGVPMVRRFDLQARLPAMKRDPDTEWLAEVNAQSLQAALKHADRTARDWHAGKFEVPRFRSRRGRQSYAVPQYATVDFEAGTVNVPKIKGIPARLSRRFDGRVVTVTISRNPAGRYHAAVMVEDGQELPEKPPLTPETQAVGLDLGLTHFVTFDTGEKVENPRHLRASLDRLAKLQRRMAKREKGSNRWHRARLAVARQHERVANQRRDHLHKLSTRLIRENQAVCVEDLCIKGLHKTRLALSISDAGWGEFVRQLTYKADWNGKHLLKCGRFERTTRRCSACGRDADFGLGTRVWTCDGCGAEHDRDANAAKLIKQTALHSAMASEAQPITVGTAG